MIAKINVEIVVRVLNADFDSIPILMFLDPDSTIANLVPLGNYLSLDRVLIPGRNTNVGVGCLDAQSGLAREGIGLRPFVGQCRERTESDDGESGEQRQVLSRVLHKI